MDERRFETLLENILNELSCMDRVCRDEAGMSCCGAHLEDAQVETFTQAGLVTGNRGLSILLADGSEFQLTIVQVQEAHS